VTGYGSETYWGGKKILLFAKYMEMAHQLGMEPEYQIFKAKLTEALTDWYTYEPGEPEHFFSLYPQWGSFMGFKTRDNGNPGIDFMQDHAFCYGYHVYAAAMLMNNDPEFAANYGEIAKLLVKDYANWDRKDTRFCTFRSLDPWCGHSWSGGKGDDRGNGMESSSESMQGWGAMMMLGEVLGDTQMRDAAIFGYSLESRAIMEYWFDRDKTNIPHDIWPYPYNSNCTTDGIGWWTWFSGDPFWMHSIQWLPMSPLLKYLYEDPAFAKWDYETMWASKTVSGWDDKLGNEAGIGNVTLSYLQIFDPDQAAALFDQLWDSNRGTAQSSPDAVSEKFVGTHGVTSQPAPLTRMKRPGAQRWWYPT
jgi:endoglucanase Acf2